MRPLNSGKRVPDMSGKANMVGSHELTVLFQMKSALHALKLQTRIWLGPRVSGPQTRSINTVIRFIEKNFWGSKIPRLQRTKRLVAAS